MNLQTSLNSEIGTNITGRSNPVLAIHKPTSTSEVQQLVLQSRRNKSPLYPISCGLNWGYGSASPATPGCSLVDLSGMNRILNAEKISISNPIAVVEAGVTQGQLYDFLQSHCPELTFNVTGSARGTSLIGNALDRGVGYFGPRKDDLFGLEVVCGSGQIIKTGFRRLGEDSPLAHSHPFGLGPMLDGLFFQGNFGIVTSACFRLMPRRPKEVAVSLALRDSSNLGLFIDELGHLKREGLMTSVTHIANKARSQASMMFGMTSYLKEFCNFNSADALIEAEKALHVVAPNEWTSLGAITGNAGQVAAAIKEIKQRMKRIARVSVITDGLLDFGYTVMHNLRFLSFARANAAAISAIRPLHALALGVPTDVAIDNLLWKYDRTDLKAIQLDQSNCGLMFISPALPPDGKIVVSLIEGMKQLAEKYGHVLYMTVNIETATSFVAIINILFDRSHVVQVDNAHRCADALLNYIHAQGLEIYRARADVMANIVSRDPMYWQSVYSLKNTFDPDNIISPGRYNIN
ncbi:FAD-binding protein [Rhodoferax sp.]|uniref:FAD-binding oxidoreductase n=1 Tax=Rhodoferax sp. TaxID=50421 RepID=UPI0025D9C29D|nr:FAD-binding protein [Rhodoferax sp.]